MEEITDILNTDEKVTDTAEKEKEIMEVLREEEEEERSREEVSIELGGEEFGVDDAEEENFLAKPAPEVQVSEDESKVTINLRDGDGGTAEEVLDLEPLLEINLNVLRTRTDLIQAMKMNQDPRSRVKFVSRPVLDDLDYLDFDNDYIIITLEEDEDDGSFLRAASRGRLRRPRGRRPGARRRPNGRRISFRG